MTAEQIIEIVANRYGYTAQLLKGRSRPEGVAFARHVAMYLIRQACGKLSFQDIGDIFGRDHGTVIHAWNRICTLTPNDKRRKDVSRLAMIVEASPPPIELGSAMKGRVVVVIDPANTENEEIYEATVLDFSEDGTYAKLRTPTGDKWGSIWRWHIIKVINKSGE